MLHAPPVLQPTWEADDGVATDACVWHVSSDAVDDVCIAGSSVATRHLAQDVVVAALKGDVEKLTQLWELCAGFDEALGEVPGMTRGKADALNACRMVGACVIIWVGPTTSHSHNHACDHSHL